MRGVVLRGEPETLMEDFSTLVQMIGERTGQCHGDTEAFYTKLQDISVGKENAFTAAPGTSTAQVLLSESNGAHDKTELGFSPPGQTSISASAFWPLSINSSFVGEAVQQNRPFDLVCFTCGWTCAPAGRCSRVHRHSAL